MSKVFFSSCFDDPVHQRLAIRDRLMTLNGEFNRDDPAQVAALPIWMAEQHRELDRNAPTAPLAMAEICVQGVRDCDVYVALVRSNHGSGIQLRPEQRTQASFFELELFEAALLQKPAYVFVLDGGEPSDRLAGLLDLLKPALPGYDKRARTEADIYDQVLRIVEAADHPRRPPAFLRKRASARQISNALTGARFNVYDPRSAAPQLRFLGGIHDPSLPRPDLDLARDAIQRASERTNHNDRLTLFWIAIRELMGWPIEASPPREVADLWGEALGGWNSAGAWYGLHGHPHMGCLAALGSLTQLRLLTSKAADIPHGGMSSEYYSIAKLVSRPALKAEVLTASRAHIDAAFLTGETSAKFAQRGSVKAAQGDKAGAIEDYRRVVALRTGEEQASDDDIGQAKTELGFALVFAGRRAEGLKEMEDGIRKFGGKPTGFLIRAQRKLGRAYIRAGSPLRALDILAQAHDNAKATGALDQLSQIDKIARRLSRKAEDPGELSGQG
jgi:tetratricopeptide (TPR) repeat protein